jgi:GT2 family glycosyltransferase/glycosyltransferase involved in cell wall biosynthesis
VNGVSILVPVYNALEDARKCIDSVYASQTSIPFEVIVVDNGSERDVAAWLAEVRRPNFRSLHFDQPLGFAGAMNAGVRLAQGHWIALLNSDTVVTDGWLDVLAAELEKDPMLGIVSPVTNRCGHEAQQKIPGKGPLVPEAQKLAFFCVLVRRTLWDQLAGLDEIFRIGNFEDDDFCLRARLAGYRMAVVPNAFVFHSERKTFEANRLNHGEFLARNQAIFAARASRWSRTVRPPIPSARYASSLSVLVPVTLARAGGLRDSLSSLANQTVQGFETIVVSPGDVSSTLDQFSGRLRLKTVTSGDEIAALLNAGLAAASGTRIAYLPAGDIFYPFHLEVLSDAMQSEDAVYTGWTVGPRGAVTFPDAEPGVELGDWAPLLCWLHRRRDQEFDSSFGAFAPWAFVLKLRDSVKARYLCRVTCERQPDLPSPGDAADVERVMAAFPIQSAWQQSQRDQFLAGVRQGNWEDRLIVSRNDRSRRAREMLARNELLRLRTRLETSVEPCRQSKPDVFLFSIIEWTSLTQRPHHFAEGLASRGHRVFWVDVRLRPPEQVHAGNLVREVKPGIYRLELPAFRGDVYRLEWRPEILDAMAACFDHLRAVHGISSAWQLVNFPRWEPLVTLLRQRFQWPVVYDCLDDQQAFADLYGHQIGPSEKILLETSSQVFVSGRALLSAIRPARPDAMLISNGVDFELFHGAQSAGLLDHLPRPIVGFFGVFADWLDLEWMEAASARFPGWSFVYIGREGFASPTARERWKALGDRRNVHVFPQAAPEKLVQYLAQMDVCIMPFLDVPVTRSMNAVKIYEYLAAGKPVVARSLPETQPLADLGLIWTYRNYEESFRLLEKAMPAEGATAFAARNTWSQRVEQLMAALGL